MCLLCNLSDSSLHFSFHARGLYHHPWSRWKGEKIIKEINTDTHAHREKKFAILSRMSIVSDRYRDGGQKAHAVNHASMNCRQYGVVLSSVVTPLPQHCFFFVNRINRTSRKTQSRCTASQVCDRRIIIDKRLERVSRVRFLLKASHWFPFCSPALFDAR